MANVVVDGVFNIPLMKKLGYKPEFAAAVEATASTGGQIMPPVMGAGAFIMAEFLSLPYIQIALAAAIPALLYYLGVASSVHFEARKSKLKRLPKEEIPSVKKTLPKSACLFVPVTILVYLMMTGYDPTTSVLWATAASVALYFVTARSLILLKERIWNIVLALEAGGNGGARELLGGIEDELRAAMLLTGSQDLRALRRAPRLVTGELAEWLRELVGYCAGSESTLTTAGVMQYFAQSPHEPLLEAVGPVCPHPEARPPELDQRVGRLRPRGVFLIGVGESTRRILILSAREIALAHPIGRVAGAETHRLSVIVIR